MNRSASVSTLLLAAVLFLSAPAAALDFVASPTIPGTQEEGIVLGLATNNSHGSPESNRVTVSPFVAVLPAESPVRYLAAADRDVQAPVFSKIAAGVSFALADESSALVIKQIALRGTGRQQSTWPRRRPIGSEAATDHIFEAGLRFRF